MDRGEIEVNGNPVSRKKYDAILLCVCGAITVPDSVFRGRPEAGRISKFTFQHIIHIALAILLSSQNSLDYPSVFPHFEHCTPP